MERIERIKAAAFRKCLGTKKLAKKFNFRTSFEDDAICNRIRRKVAAENTFYTKKDEEE